MPLGRSLLSSERNFFPETEGKIIILPSLSNCSNPSVFNSLSMWSRDNTDLRGSKVNARFRWELVRTAVLGVQIFSKLQKTQIQGFFCLEEAQNSGNPLSRVFFCFTSIANWILQIKWQDTGVQSSSSCKFSTLLKHWIKPWSCLYRSIKIWVSRKPLGPPFFSSTRLPFTQILDFQ